MAWVLKMVSEHKVKSFAEVGVLEGQLADGLISAHPEIQYCGVERWIEDKLRERFAEWTKNRRAVAIYAMSSLEAAPFIDDGSMDMVYIDADHTYENVRNDILLWGKKVKNGGILAGHDYNPDGGYGTHRAVNELVEGFHLQEDDASKGNKIWWTIKTPTTLKLPGKEILYVTDYQTKKLVDYLSPGKKVLIRFGHGWGDTQMFIPLYQKLVDLYPDVHFDLYVECGQEEIFPSYPTKDSDQHDLIFHLDFPMSEGSDLTKAEKCCKDELGIPFGQPPVAVLPKQDNPFVLCHFQGTALPDSVNCPEPVAQKIWQEIIDAGKIPIECHFEHIFHNPVNAKYSFIDSNVRKVPAKLSKLIAMMQHSFAFIGVASGPFVTALSTYPDRVMFLENRHKLHSYVKLPVSKVDVTKYGGGEIKTWLESLMHSGQT